MQKVAIRVDASPEIGLGHLTRCLTLAEELREREAQVFFLTHDQTGAMVNWITDQGYACYGLPGGDWMKDAEATKKVVMSEENVSWLVLDHYHLDDQWEKQMRPYVQKIMVIDDLADRGHDCDLILDQTFEENGARYEGLIPADCNRLFGSQYALLRKGFTQQRNQPKQIHLHDQQQTVHIFFGGMDQRNHTIRFGRLLARYFNQLKLEIVVGKGFEHIAELSALGQEYGSRVRWNQNTADMADSMARSTVALGAPGMTTWERACMGLPAAYIATSMNQKPILEWLEEKGFCIFLGMGHTISDDQFLKRFASFIENVDRLKELSRLSSGAVDGGGTDRVVSFMLSNSHSGS